MNVQNDFAEYEFKSAKGPLSTAPDRIGYLTPSDPQEPMAALQQKYQRDGYLYLKGLLDQPTVRDFRAWVFEHLAPAGLLQDGSEPVDGLATQGTADGGRASQLLMDIVRSARFEGFCAQRRLTDFIEDFFGGVPRLYKRKLMRFTLPHADMRTDAHYDRVYLRGGTTNLVTAWIPIGDVSLTEGGLLYLEGSHKIGADMEADYDQKAKSLPEAERISAFNSLMKVGGEVTDDLAPLAEQYDTRWLTASYEAGDVVLHSPYMIHGATENVHSGGRMRLSADIRFQRVDELFDERWGNDWTYDDNL